MIYDRLDIDGQEAIVRSLEPEDLGSALTLLRSTFEQDWPSVPVDSPADYLEWKINGPNAGVGAQRVLEIEGELVAFATRQIRRARVNGVEVTVTTGGDMVLDRRYQKRGLVSQLQPIANEMDRDLGMRIGVTDHPSLLKTRQARGNKPLANEVQLVTRPVNFWAQLGRSLGRPSPRRLRDVAVALRMRSLGMRLRRRDAVDPADVEVKEVARFDQRIDEFAARALEPFDFALTRGCELLNWRYADPAGGAFRIWLAEEDGEVLGYATTAQRGRQGAIADLLAAPGREDVALALVRAAVDALAAEKRVELVGCWLPNSHPYRRLFLQEGFTIKPSPYGVTFIPLAAGDTVAFLETDPEARIHLMEGDTDVL